MSAMTGIAIYDPRRLTETDFLAGFIARNDLFEHLLEQLRQTVETGEPRHRLIVGTRGMGKTSLLRRLAIGISNDPNLFRGLVPLTFREEQYNVRSLEQFWRNCGEALAEWFERNGDPDAADRLDQDVRGAAWTTADAAADAFLGRVAALGRRAVLLVDNLDLILNALPEDRHWKLRRRLQDPRGPIMIGASTQMLRQSGDRDSAFYEFFRPETLTALTEAELLHCIRHLAQARGEAGRPVMDILTREPERLRVLHTLTGGNPRILTLLYQLLERAESETVFADLEALLDQMTPLYKARVEELGTELQRAMLDAIALHWDPITSHDLSAATSVAVTTVSSQLARLQEFGYVEVVPTSGARSGYQIGERFFNIWYLMRHGTRRTRQRLRWLTAFLNSFYTREDLRRMRGRLAPNPVSRWHPGYLEALEAAIENSGNRRSPTDLGLKKSDIDYDTLSSEMYSLNIIERIFKIVPIRGYSAAEDFCHEAIARDSNDIGAWIGLGFVLENNPTRYNEAETAYREAIARGSGNPGPWVALAMLLQNRLGRYDEAEAAYREAIACDPEYAYPRVKLGYLLERHLGRYDEAEAAYREAVARNPEDAYPRVNLGDLLQQHFNRYDEAEAEYREAIARDHKYAYPWVRLGNLLQVHLGRYDEAEAAYREAIARDPEYAYPRASLGYLLERHLGRYDEAEAAYREAIARDPKDAFPWIKLGDLLQQHLDRYGEAEAAYREAIACDPEDAYPRVNLGDLLERHLGRYDEAEAAYREAIAHDPKDAFPWFRLGNLLQQHLGRYDEAETAYREAIARDPEKANPWFGLGSLLQDHLGRYDDAETAYREAMRLTGQTFGLAQANLPWLYFAAGDDAAADQATRDLPADVHLVGHRLLDIAGLVARDDLGMALTQLDDVLTLPLTTQDGTNFGEDLLRLIRLFVRRGHGERLIGWFEESGQADRNAPLYSALVAYVRGAEKLRDINPEVRGAASKMHAWLVAEPRPEAKRDPKPKRRGRPPKRR